MKNKSNNSIKITSYIFIGIILLLIINYAYFILFESQDILNNPYNKRGDVLEETILRGNIYSKDFDVLATSIENEDGTVVRYYPYADMFAHVVGRHDKGKTGIEQSQNMNLLKVDKYDSNTLKNEIIGVKNKGYSVVTTLDTNLQKIAYEELGDRKGAVVVIEPSTGRILAMVSKPSYDPNTIIDDWDKLTDEDNEDSNLLNRVTSGIYPPGSTFKVIMAMEYIMENPKDYDKYNFKCIGKSKYSESVISCHNNKKHGNVDLYDALAYSCNTSFSNIGINLDINKLKNFCEDLGFNKALAADKVGYTAGQFVLDENSTETEIVQTSIGQGKTMITPFQNALIMCMIESGGVLCEPYIVSGLVDENRKIVENFAYENKSIKVFDENLAKNMKKMLKGVVEKGTAKDLRKLDLEIYGKTGSAEYNDKKDAHGWFVGCAKAEGKEPIVIAVIVEDGETGSKSAVPIAKELFKAYKVG